MTNKPMFSVERELLSSICDDFEAGQHSKACEGASKLRAILDDKYRAPPINIHCHATNVQIISNEDGSYTLINKVDQEQNPKITGRVYSFSADETALAAQHQGGVTLEQVLKAYDYANSHPHKYLRGTTNWCAAVAHALNVQQSAPVADHTQCEECKGWGYHENHHESGGTECGECGGSGKAPVSVVMPEPYSLAMFQMISRFESVTPEQFELVWSACREEVSRLNGIKP